MVSRKSKVISIEQAASMVKDGMTIFIGGFTSSSHPMAIVRQIIKNKIKDLTVVGAATSSIELDIMIAAGCAKKIVAPYIGIEGHAPMGPFFRAYAQDNMVEIWEIDEAGHYAALRAAANGYPYSPEISLLGTDYVKENNPLNPDLKLYADPITGRPMVAVPAVKPDIAFIYAAASDYYGNAQIIGSAFGDRTGARASDVIVIQAERLISNEEIRQNPQATTLPKCQYVTQALFGAHPFSSPAHYTSDNKWIAEYVEAGNAYLREKDRTKIDAFLDKYIYQPKDHVEYLEVIGLRQLCSLNEY